MTIKGLVVTTGNAGRNQMYKVLELTLVTGEKRHLDATDDDHVDVERWWFRERAWFPTLEGDHISRRHVVAARVVVDLPVHPDQLVEVRRGIL
jgi:hypothetical protein